MLPPSEIDARSSREDSVLRPYSQEVTMRKNRVVENADNELLLPSPYGFVSEVNGPDAVEVPDFVPTRHELLQIARYWANVELDLEFLMATTGVVGSDWLRQTSFAGRRLGRIDRASGDDGVQRVVVVEQVRQEFSESVDPRWWKAFVEGDATELRRIADERHSVDMRKG